MIKLPKENIDEDELKKIKKLISNKNIDDNENYLNKKRTKDNFDNKINNNNNYKPEMNNTNYDFSLMESESETIFFTNQNKINEFKNSYNLLKSKKFIEIDIKTKK